jgi:hypothetical protein
MWPGSPFSQRKEISTRIRNHETAVAKVNDANGNPIEIAAVVARGQHRNALSVSR